MSFLDETGLARLWSKIKAKDEAIEDEIDTIKSNLVNLEQSLTWTYAGWAIFGQSVTLPADYTEARIYLLFKNSVQSTREMVEMTFFKSLWSEAVNGSIILQPSGYFLGGNDWGYYAVKVTNNGRTFESEGAKWGGVNVDGISGVMVYYR
jgi:hypothetical protein